MEETQGLKYIHAWHYDMLLHHERSQFYCNLIKENCRGKTVLEIGTGSGLMAALAVKYGAEKVICCEENPMLAMAARQLFQRLGIENKIELISRNSKEIKTDELPPIDVILHELFASDPFGEEMVPTLRDAQRFLKPGGIFLPDSFQIIYQPLPSRPLPERLSFDGIELTEMSALLRQVHPALRMREPGEFPPEGFALPAVTVQDVINKSYLYTETHERLRDIDAVEVSFLILHGRHKMQAAPFGTTSGERVHWYPLVFYKLDTGSNQLQFSVKDDIQLRVM